MKPLSSTLREFRRHADFMVAPQVLTAERISPLLSGLSEPIWRPPQGLGAIDAGCGKERIRRGRLRAHARTLSGRSPSLRKHVDSGSHECGSSGVCRAVLHADSGGMDAAPGVKTIRVHPEGLDLGRNWPLDLGIVSDENFFLQALADGIPRKKRDSWVAELAAARARFDKANANFYALGLKYSRDTNSLHPCVIAKEVHDFSYKSDIDPKQTLTGVAGNTMRSWSGRWIRAQRPAQEIEAHYQFGAMGTDMAMLMGACAAVKEGVGPQAPYKGAPVIVITGDAGVGYSLMELDTRAKYKFPLITVVYNNNAWGTWVMAHDSPRATHMHLLQENLRYDKAAEGLGYAGNTCARRKSCEPL